MQHKAYTQMLAASVLSSGVGIAQSVERWIVVPVVEGSSPFAHPPLIRLFFIDKIGLRPKPSERRIAGTRRKRDKAYRGRFSRNCGPLAQLAEQRTLNPLVEGSIPSRLTPSAAWWNW